MVEKIVQPDIYILNFPVTSGAVIPAVSNLIDVLRPLTGHLHLIIGNVGFSKENREIDRARSMVKNIS